MSINFNCPNRVKPRLLREQKTEALLVFIRTTLEQSLKDGDKDYTLDLATKEDTQYVYNSLQRLLENLQECVVNSSYLQSLVQNSGKNKAMNMIVEKEKPLLTYYDSIVRSIRNNLPSGSSWIPELMVVALLSHWILEEEKSTYLYPFLNDFDYLTILEKFDKARSELDKEKKDVFMNMYELSTKLIESLIKAKYKTSSKQTKKRSRR